MTETEKLKEQLYERMQQENESFMTEVKAMSVDGIIGCAYEITYRDTILMLFEDETMLSPRQLKVLLGFEHPLSVLYRDWCNRDTDLMDTLRSCVQSCADDILHEQAVEKYSDPQTSVYAKSLTEARISGEYYEWYANHRRNNECVQAFEKEGTIAYLEHALPEYLQKWTAEYGKERCSYVLACTIAQRGGDDRFSLPTRQMAAHFTTLHQSTGDHTTSYACGAHSCIVNAAMEYLAKAEHNRTQDKSTPPKKREQRER